MDNTKDSLLPALWTTQLEHVNKTKEIFFDKLSWILRGSVNLSFILKGVQSQQYLTIIKEKALRALF